jgi:DNA polymerase I-like protein with 3'-5' exonuclease and polymerase domains
LKTPAGRFLVRPAGDSLSFARGASNVDQTSVPPPAPPDNGAAPRTAHALFALGLLPVPVPYRTKKCVLPGYPDFRRETLDLDELFPDDGGPRNVGVVLGGVSGRIVDADLDVHEAVVAADTLLPDTGWVFGRRGKPRSHREYRAAGRAANSAQYRDPDGTMLAELRADRRMTVYPGSTHESGERVEWDRFSTPAELPAEDLENAVARVAAAALLARHWPAEGGRQDAALALAGGLCRAGWDDERVEKFIRAVCTAAGDEEVDKRVKTVMRTHRKIEDGGKATGWPKLAALLDQGESVVRQARAWLRVKEPGGPAAKRPPRRLAPYRPFPVAALPAPLDALVREGAAALGCDPAYLAVPALCVAASAVGNTRTLRLKRGWYEPSVLWGAVVGDSGTLKSPALRLVLAPVHDRQFRLSAEYKEQLRKYDADLERYDEEKKQAKKDGTDPPEKPEKPKVPYVLVKDLTVETLGPLLEDNPRGLLDAVDELATWLASFTRYKGKSAGSDLPYWLSMNHADSLIITRKTGDRPHIHVRRAAVSVCGGIQPGVLKRAFTQEFLDSGGAARLLLALPPKKVKRWTEAEVGDGTEQAYRTLLERLYGLTFAEGDEQRPVVLWLSPCAKAAWVAFYDDWAECLAGSEDEIAAARAKLEAYAARFALVHHVVTCAHRGADTGWEVGAESVESGIALCRWFAHEADRIYGLLYESDTEWDGRRLLEFIQRRGGLITVRQLHRSNQRKYRTADDAEQALNTLVAAGVGDWHQPPTSAAGQTPTRVFTLRPADDEDGDPPPEPPRDRACDTTNPDTQNPGILGGCVTHVTRHTASPAKNEAKREPGPEPQLLNRPPVEGVTDLPPREADRGYAPPQEREGPKHPPKIPRAPCVTCDTCDTAPKNPEKSRSVKSIVTHELGTATFPDVAQKTPPYALIDRAEDLGLVADAVRGSTLVGLDTETTGLCPRRDRVRLLTLDCDAAKGGRRTYVVDCFAVDPSPLWGPLAGVPLVVHNAIFDLAMLAPLGFAAGAVHDTLILARLLAAGTNERCRLEDVVPRYLGHPLDKGQQKSDWSVKALTEAQLRSAATDAHVLPPLFAQLTAEIICAGLERVAEIQHRALPAVLWLARSGVGFDRAAWEALAVSVAAEAGRLAEALDAAAPPRPGGGPWNWRSNPQVKEAFALVGVTLEATNAEALAAVGHPLAALLLGHRAAAKRASNYGRDWLKHVAADGHVYADWNQLGACSGRMSCSGRNLQQVPRDTAYRRCFRAPPGRVLVKADYSQIELRIAAKLSGDKVLLDAYRRGEDLHKLTARTVLGKETVTKEDRQLAKVLNFGLLYGMGARRFRDYAANEYGVEMTEEQAQEMRAAFFRTYHGLAAWHRKAGAGGKNSVDTRTLCGRRRLNVLRFTEKLNTPDQGTGADGLKQALALLWERRAEAPGAFPVLIVHDEIVVECDRDRAEAVGAWLKRCMVDGMAPLIAPVPVEVEVTAADTWGG